MTERQPEVVPMAQSPFDFEASAWERHRRSQALDADVITDEAGLMIMFRRGDDVETLLTDRRFAAVAMPVLEFSGVTEGPLHDLWSLLMFGKDGVEHQRIRRAVSTAFRTRAVERHRPVAARFAHERADHLEEANNGAFDLWEGFAVPVTARVTCHVVGIPENEADQVARWAIDLVNAFFVMDAGARERAEGAAIALLAYLDVHLDRLRTRPGNDVASALLAAQRSDQNDLTDDELRALVANLIFGGLEATAKAMTTGVYHLLTQNRWGMLVDRPEIAPTAVAELLRFAPPISTARLAAEDLEVCAVAMQAGQMAILDADGPCRDPHRYENPHELNLERAPGRQLAFGAGAHYCLGAHLATVVLEEALTALASRFPSLRLAGGEDEVDWDYTTFNGIIGLRVLASD